MTYDQDAGRAPATVGETERAVIARRVQQTADGVAASTCGRVPVTAAQRAVVLGMALDLLGTAARHGVTRFDLDAGGDTG